MIRKIAATSGWHFPFKRVLGSRRPVVLMYHGVPKSTNGTGINIHDFERHVLFLKQHFEMIGPDAIDDKRSSRDKIRALLTFDDGFRNNAELVAPILRRYRVPAIFFVCNRHAQSGKYLWFSYLKKLETSFRGNGFVCEGEYMDMSAARRRQTMKDLERRLMELRPHPLTMYQIIDEQLPRLEDFSSIQELNDTSSGMTTEQIAELAANELFTIGAHTADHPCLTRCDDVEAERQIRSNKVWIEELTGRTCDVIAYPNADYKRSIVDLCRSLGFSRGYAVNRSLNYDQRYEVQRTGVYTAPLTELGFKARWGKLAHI